MSSPLFSRIYNPQVDDYDEIINRAAPQILVGSTFLSATAIRLDFASTDTPSGKPTAVVLQPYVKLAIKPKH
jgi:hypothetical protein